MGNTPTQNPKFQSEKDMKIANKVEISGFFKRTNASDFQHFIDNVKVYTNICEMPFKYFILLHKQTFYTISDEEKKDLEEFLNQPLNPSPETFDMLWMLFHASGNTLYAEKVLKLGRESSDPVLINCALWSYKSHVEQGYVKPLE